MGHHTETTARVTLHRLEVACNSESSNGQIVRLVEQGLTLACALHPGLQQRARPNARRLSAMSLLRSSKRTHGKDAEKARATLTRRTDSISGKENLCEDDTRGNSRGGDREPAAAFLLPLTGNTPRVPLRGARIGRTFGARDTLSQGQRLRGPPSPRLAASLLFKTPSHGCSKEAVERAWNIARGTCSPSLAYGRRRGSRRETSSLHRRICPFTAVIPPE